MKSKLSYVVKSSRVLRKLSTPGRLISGSAFLCLSFTFFRWSWWAMRAAQCFGSSYINHITYFNFFFKLDHNSKILNYLIAESVLFITNCGDYVLCFLSHFIQEDVYHGKTSFSDVMALEFPKSKIRNSHSLENVKLQYLLRTHLVSAVLEVAADERKRHNVPILGRKFQAHVKLAFKDLVVEATG